MSILPATVASSAVACLAEPVSGTTAHSDTERPRRGREISARMPHVLSGDRRSMTTVSDRSAKASAGAMTVMSLPDRAENTFCLPNAHY